MLNFIVETIIWILCIYGVLSIIKDWVEENSYKKVKNNTELILTVKNAGNRNRKLHKKIMLFWKFLQ